MLISLLAGSSCDDAKTGGMMNGNFRGTLGEAVRTDGPSYVRNRQRLVDTPSYEVPLEQVLGSSKSWEETWVARIALSWRRHRSLFSKAADLIEGRLSGPPPVMGKFPVVSRVKELSGLGEDIAPRLIEIVWKTKEYDGPAEIGTVFGALRELKAADTTSPLRSLLAPRTPIEYRRSAISTLGELRDSMAAAEIRDIYMDPREREDVRATALHAYSKYERPDTYQMLADAIQDRRIPEGLTTETVRELGSRQDAGTRQLFEKLIRAGAQGDLQSALVDGLRNHGNEESVRLLQDLLKKTEREDLQIRLEEVIEEIKHRLSGG